MTKTNVKNLNQRLFNSVGAENIKEVPGYEGIYCTKSGIVYKTNSEGLLVRCPDGIIRGKCKDYARVSFLGKSYIVSRVVARTFINPNLSLESQMNGKKRTSLLDVDHIDNNTLNNNVSNLQVLTHQENIYKRSKEVGSWSNKPNKTVYIYNIETKEVLKFDTTNDAVRYMCSEKKKNYNPGYLLPAYNNKRALFKTYSIGYTEDEAKSNYTVKASKKIN